jgi:hypothetical protein
LPFTNEEISTFLMDDLKNARGDTVFRVTGRKFQTSICSYKKGSRELRVRLASYKVFVEMSAQMSERKKLVDGLRKD